MSCKRSNCTVKIGFDLYHKVIFRIECATKKKAGELLEKLEGSKYADGEVRTIQLPDKEHSSYDESYGVIDAVVNRIFDVIPE